MSLVAEKPIDGTLPDEVSTPIGALNEFYRAFNSRDLALMQQNWENSEEAAMDNPLGGIKRGWSEIEPVYERIFAGDFIGEAEVKQRANSTIIRCTRPVMFFGRWGESAERWSVGIQSYS